MNHKNYLRIIKLGFDIKWFVDMEFEELSETHFLG